MILFCTPETVIHERVENFFYFFTIGRLKRYNMMNIVKVLSFTSLRGMYVNRRKKKEKRKTYRARINRPGDPGTLDSCSLTTITRPCFFFFFFSPYFFSFILTTRAKSIRVYLTLGRFFYNYYHLWGINFAGFFFFSIHYILVWFFVVKTLVTLCYVFFFFFFFFLQKYKNKTHSLIH